MDLDAGTDSDESMNSAPAGHESSSGSGGFDDAPGGTYRTPSPVNSNPFDARPSTPSDSDYASISENETDDEAGLGYEEDYRVDLDALTAKLLEEWEEAARDEDIDKYCEFNHSLF